MLKKVTFASISILLTIGLILSISPVSAKGPAKTAPAQNPDLAVEKVLIVEANSEKILREVNAGEPFRAQALVRNKGKAPSGGAQVVFAVSGANPSSVTAQVGSLEPGWSETVTVSDPVMVDKAGKTNVSATVHPTDKNGDDKGNNQTAASFAVKEKK